MQPWPDSNLTDGAYSPSRIVPQFRAILEEYRQLSDVAKRTLPCTLNVRYGEGPGEILHHFPPAQAGSPLLVYVHGGHWQELSIEESCFPALALFEQGIGFAAVGYQLAPEAKLDAMVASVARALEWVVGNATALGTAPEKVYAAGSSAGAHLLAVALGSGPRGAEVELAGAMLLSGVYELSGIRHTYVNVALGLTEDEATRNSPLHCLPLRARQILVARGEIETAEYCRQQQALLAGLRRVEGAVSRSVAVRSLVCRGRNHFDLPLGIGRPVDELGQAGLAQMRLKDAYGDR